MLNIFRPFGSRISHGTWASRKQIFWTLFIMSMALIFYVQYSADTLDKFSKDLTNAHSLVHQKIPETGNEAGSSNFGSKSADSVKFIPREAHSYTKHPRGEPVENLGARLRPPGFSKKLVNDMFYIKTSPSRARQFEPNPEFSPTGQRQDVYFPPVRANPALGYPEGNEESMKVIGNDVSSGEAAKLWQEGSYRFNQFREPIYSHDNRPNYVPKQRVVHFDLKGAPPLPSMYKTLIPWLAKYGATAILLEYEDMFPWQGHLKPLAAKNHYSKKDIKDILEICRMNKIEVIPLVQTFGHLEYALKLVNFSYLREVATLPQSLCPSNNDSQWLVNAMIDQIMAIHPKVSYLHIGCDEVFQLGECNLCRNKMPDDLFLSHVSKTAIYVRSKHKVTPIIWHDMLGHMSDTTLLQYDFGKLVEPMIWVYAEDVYRFVQPSQWTKFSRVFPYVWTASAFKGAFGEQSVAPNILRHLDNNLNWLDVMSSEEAKFSGGIKGLVLTGWQRHDHFAVLCELIPSALPSLAINLITVSKGFFNSTLVPFFLEALTCLTPFTSRRSFDLENDPYLFKELSSCHFPGSSFFRKVTELEEFRREWRTFYDRLTLKRAWITDYNIRHNYSTPMRIDEDLRDVPSQLHRIKMYGQSTHKALLEWFDDWTASEWVEQHILPMYHALNTLMKNAEGMKQVNHWPVRPLPPSKLLEDFEIQTPVASRGSFVKVKEKTRSIYN